MRRRIVSFERKFLIRPFTPPPRRAMLRASMAARSPIWDRFRRHDPNGSFATFQAVFWPELACPRCSLAKTYRRLCGQHACNPGKIAPRLAHADEFRIGQELHHIALLSLADLQHQITA